MSPPGPAPQPGRRSRRWFRKRGIDLGDLAVNSFAAFLGVFIALTVQSWRDRHDGEVKLAKARTAIRAELTGNRDLVRRKLDYLLRIEHNGVALINGDMPPQPDVDTAGDADLQRAAAHSKVRNPCTAIPGYNGFALASLTRAAYDSAQTAGVLATMDYEESRRIAGAYAVQAIYGQAFDRQAYLLQRMFETGDRYLCVTIAAEEAFYSQDLLSAYAAYLGAGGTRP